MPLRGRVGRHNKTGGRHCQNWADDQQTVIDLLNRISAGEGGAGGSLGGRIVAGIASDALFQAILRFEDKQFPRQRSGFVDPGGAMLKRMEALTSGGATAPTAAPPKPAAVETTFDKLPNVLDERVLRSPGQMVDFDPLVKMAVKHMDDLKRRVSPTPWPVEMQCRAHVMKGLATFINTTTMTVVWGDSYELFFISRAGVDDHERAAPRMPMLCRSPPNRHREIGSCSCFRTANVCGSALPQTVSNLVTTKQYLAKKTYTHHVMELSDHP